MHTRFCVTCGTPITDQRIKNKKNALYCSTKCIKTFWKLSNRESDILSKRKYQMGKRYGITWEEVLQKHEQQNGCCAICRIPIPLLTEKCKAYIDHNHNTGIIRGILCHSCNKLIGFSKENVNILSTAIEYLKKF